MVVNPVTGVEVSVKAKLRIVPSEEPPIGEDVGEKNNNANASLVKARSRGVAVAVYFE